MNDCLENFWCESCAAYHIKHSNYTQHMKHKYRQEVIREHNSRKGLYTRL